TDKGVAARVARRQGGPGGAATRRPRWRGDQGGPGGVATRWPGDVVSRRPGRVATWRPVAWRRGGPGGVATDGPVAMSSSRRTPGSILIFQALTAASATAYRQINCHCEACHCRSGFSRDHDMPWRTAAGRAIAAEAAPTVAIPDAERPRTMAIPTAGRPRTVAIPSAARPRTDAIPTAERLQRPARCAGRSEERRVGNAR